MSSSRTTPQPGRPFENPKDFPRPTTNSQSYSSIWMTKSQKTGPGRGRVEPSSVRTRRSAPRATRASLRSPSWESGASRPPGGVGRSADALARVRKKGRIPRLESGLPRAAEGRESYKVAEGDESQERALARDSHE